MVVLGAGLTEDSTAIRATAAATGKTYQARVIGCDKTGDIARPEPEKLVRPAAGGRVRP